MRFRIALVSCLSIAALSGCTLGRGDLEQWVAAEKAKKGAPLDPLPVVKTFETFEYKDQDLRDPFSPSVEEQRQEEAASAGGANAPDQNRTREPLEAAPLDSLMMVGTMGTGNAVEGLVKDADGVVHRVHVNNYLGQNYGRITSIAEDHIELVELISNGSGGWMERQASIALGEK